MRGLAEGVELAQYFLDLGLLLLAVGGGGVADVEQHLGLLDFFERGSEAGHESVGQIADKSDGIGEQHPAPAGQFDGAQFGVERRKHPRRLQDVSPGQTVEQRAFAGVGVAHQGHGGNRNRFAPLALLPAHTAHRVKIES